MLVLVLRLCISLARFWQFVMSFGENMFSTERKWLAFSRHDFSVYTAAASGNQPEADGLPQGNNGAAAANYILCKFKKKKNVALIFFPYVVMYETTWMNPVSELW